MCVVPEELGLWLAAFLEINTMVFPFTPSGGGPGRPTCCPLLPPYYGSSHFSSPETTFSVTSLPFHYSHFIHSYYCCLKVSFVYCHASICTLIMYVCASCLKVPHITIIFLAILSHGKLNSFAYLLRKRHKVQEVKLLADNRLFCSNCKLRGSGPHDNITKSSSSLLHPCSIGTARALN